MCLEIGNKVAVLDDVIKGIIVRIDNNTVTIKDEGGMQFQFEKKELVKIAVEQNELAKYSDIDHQLLKDKMNIVSKKKSLFVKDKKEVIMEVDLHINQLTKSTRGMDNFDMLTLQLDTAKKKIEYCIQKRISKIVFIHGVGEGVLKTELHYLCNKYPVRYYDASYQKYGLGATEVYIFQNPN